MRGVRPIVPEKTRRHLEWDRVLARLAEHCRGPVAAAQAHDLAFAEDMSELADRQARTTEARALLDRGFGPPVGSVPEVAGAASRAARGGVLEAEELVALGQHLDTAARCRKYLVDVAGQAPALAAVARELADLPGLGRELLDTFDERGGLQDSASGELGFLRGRVANLHEGLKQQIHSLLSDSEYEGMLQDEYYTIREDRYVLPIKSGHKRHVPGIVHGWSQTGATVYIEPQAVMEANNRLLMAQADVDREVRRILGRLSKMVGEEAAAIRRSQEALATLDLAMAAGRLSKELDATPPTIERGALSLRRARHPLLALAGISVVPNDLELQEGQRVLVVTGPNTGGKTVALKTVGLCTLMALCGLHVPAAPGSRIPRVPGVFTDIGDPQSLDEAHSTFSGHLANITAILNALRPGSLVLLDELAVGTDPAQGAALAQAILEALADREALGLVTTHYETLKVLPFQDPRFRNGAMGFDASTASPTYHLRYDVPGSSSALATAQRLGLDRAIVARATELAGPQQARLQAVIETLEAEAAQLRKAREQAESEKRKAEVSRTSAEALEEKWRKRLREGLATERDQALREARQARDEIERLRRQLKAPELKGDADFLDKKRGRVERVIGQLADARASAQAQAAGPPLDKRELRIGQKVHVLSLGNDAEITRLPDDRGRVEVRAGILTATVDLSDLRPPGKRPKGLPEPDGPKPKQPQPRGPVSWDDAPPQTPDNTVDVRGMRADDAMEEVERFLDVQYERDAQIAFVIHGHGTGALKKLIRAWLAKSRYVRDQRPGLPHEGGDGVTAVLLA